MNEITKYVQDGEWGAYGCCHHGASFAHALGWGESLAETYGLPIFRLAITDKSSRSLAGILPLMLFAAPDRDKRLISLPYTDAAGIVADDRTSGNKLLAAAFELALVLGARHIELRQAGDLPFDLAPGDAGDCWHHIAHTFKTGLRRPLPDSVGELWASLPAKVRNQVRKALKCGCTAVIGGGELLDDFYAVFSENMRDLGSPVHAEELMRRLLNKTSLYARVIVVRLAAKPVAAAIVFRQGATLGNPWASSLRSHRPACPNMLLYWAMLELALGEGCRWFDFGRSSPGGSTCRFKCQWGASMEPLTWHVFSQKPHRWDPLSETLVDAEWQSLDLAVSRRKGPNLRRWISL